MYLEICSMEIYARVNVKQLKDSFYYLYKMWTYHITVCTCEPEDSPLACSTEYLAPFGVDTDDNDHIVGYMLVSPPLFLLWESCQLKKNIPLTQRNICLPRNTFRLTDLLIILERGRISIGRYIDR